MWACPSGTRASDASPCLRGTAGRMRREEGGRGGLSIPAQTKPSPMQESEEGWAAVRLALSICPVLPRPSALPPESWPPAPPCTTRAPPSRPATSRPHRAATPNPFTMHARPLTAPSAAPLLHTIKPLPLPPPPPSACTPVFVGFGLVWAGIYNPPPPPLFTHRAPPPPPRSCRRA